MSADAMAARGSGPGERPAYRLHYASFESRVAAGALDVLVMFIIASLLVTAGSVIVLISSDFERVEPSTTALNLFWACVACIPVALVLYFFIGYAWKGQTVGAAVMQLMVIRSDGRPLGVIGSMARVIGLLFYVLIVGVGLVAAYALQESTALAGGALAVALVVAALGIIWAAFDRHRRTLHDRLAGTIVVRLV
ncbi:RDD family protein [Tepidiforma sp.]|uniref:RDD family protein n=1 Tax=Tepidiforma sp. TaxID=2682230 RepID=UPI002ADE6EFE|nr:RDD family protein [Tepidiforma sp.]